MKVKFLIVSITMIFLLSIVIGYNSLLNLSLSPRTYTVASFNEKIEAVKNNKDLEDLRKMAVLEIETKRNIVLANSDLTDKYFYSSMSILLLSIICFIFSWQLKRK
jgi:uncharacterized membrane protein (DUF106 family)